MSESQEQCAFIDWARLHRQRWPQLNHLYAIPNGAATSNNNRARLVREGLVCGVCDLHLPVPRGTYHGLWIEMKKIGGCVSEEQCAWLVAMKDYGHQVTVAYSWTSAVIVLEEYLNLGPFAQAAPRQAQVIEKSAESIPSK